MFKRLKDLFRRAEPKEVGPILTFDDLPSWLNSREEEIRGNLSDATTPYRETIHDALDRLGEAINSIETAEGAEKVHPRLRDISRKALPQFTKSMSQILSRELSDDSEDFYFTVADILKSALKIVRGQGKYLSSLYPDEMREVRAAIRDLGRGLNPLAEAVAQAHSDRKQIEDIRKSYESLVRIRAEYADISNQIQGYVARSDEIGEMVQRGDEDLVALELRPDYDKKEGIREEIRELDAIVEGMMREAISTRATALHVFRKAGKVAAKVGGDAAAADFDLIHDIYTVPLPEDESALVGLIESVMPMVLAMIRQGDLTLKNQEEIALFSSPDTLPSEIEETIRHQREVQEQRAALQVAYDSLPSVIEENHLTTLLSDLQNERETVTVTLNRAEGQREILSRSYAEEVERLHDAFADQGAGIDIPTLSST